MDSFKQVIADVLKDEYARIEDALAENDITKDSFLERENILNSIAIAAEIDNWRN